MPARWRWSRSAISPAPPRRCRGLITTTGGALIGLAIGQAFDGTTVPLTAGFALCGALALGVALWANAGLPAHAATSSASRRVVTRLEIASE